VPRRDCNGSRRGRPCTIRPHLGAPAANAAFAFHRAAIARPRGQPGQGGGSATIHGAQFRQEHERQQSGPEAHPFDLGQAIHALLKRRLGLHQFFDFLFAGGDLGLVVGEPRRVLLADKGVGVMLRLGLDHRAVVDELFAPERQFRYFAAGRRHGGGGLRLEALAVIGQRLRVTRVGFVRGG